MPRKEAPTLHKFVIGKWSEKRRAALLCFLSSAHISTDPWKERDDIVEIEFIAPQPH